MDPKLPERRQARRYPMEVPMRVGSDEGWTRDLSSRGVYFIATTRMEPGSMVEMDVTLTNACAQGPVTLHMRGRIIRVDELEESLGLAAVIETWDITDVGAPGFVEAGRMETREG